MKTGNPDEEKGKAARIPGADRPAGRAGPAGADDRGAGLISGWHPLIIQLSLIPAAPE
jgi:hypothetical protein